MSICLKPPSQTIHCICLCSTIILYPTHYICLHVFSVTSDTKPGMLCRLDSNTLPRYAVSSEACVFYIKVFFSKQLFIILILVLFGQKYVTNNIFITRVYIYIYIFFLIFFFINIIQFL